MGGFVGDGESKSKNNDDDGNIQHLNNRNGIEMNLESSSTKRQKKGRKRKSKIGVTEEDGDAFVQHSDLLFTDDQNLKEAIRRDDMEIAQLEKKLGMSGGTKKSKRKSMEKLNKEYAKLEGYGDGFGIFLDDLDDMVD